MLCLNVSQAACDNYMVLHEDEPGPGSGGPKPGQAFLLYCFTTWVCAVPWTLDLVILILLYICDTICKISSSQVQSGVLFCFPLENLKSGLSIFYEEKKEM